MNDHPARQLLLDFATEPEPRLESFIEGDNRDVLLALGAVVSRKSTEAGIHIWGEPGSGRTHLLRSVATQRQGRYFSCEKEWSLTIDDPSVRVWAIDDVDRASAQQQHDLFNLINEVRSQPGAIVLSASDLAPLQLGLREDLRTRLGWGLVFQVHRLSDKDMESALAEYALGRGLALPAEVGHYLMTHFARNMATLTRIVDALDCFALAQHRPVTLVLLRQWMSTLAVSSHAP